VAKGESTVVLHHGRWVEVRDTVFLEGAWSGLYSALDFADAPTFTGSGGCLTPNGLLCATPTHTLEPLYVLRVGRILHCSNSLPFVLAYARDDVDASYRYYDVDITSLAFGTRRCCSRVPTRNHNWVYLYYYSNILLGGDLSMTVQPKSEPPAFSSYAQYYAFLQEQVSTTLDNAAHPERRVTYAPLLTLSTGYDSSAAAVLATAAGCREAITFTTARDALGAEADDGGGEIGAILGLDVTEYDPKLYRTRIDYPEAEFVASGGGGGSVVLTAAEERLAGAILVTGHYGGEAWERANNKGGPGMVTFDSAGADLIHFRLRTGFLHLTVPSIGYSRYECLQQITGSPEMRPWSLGREDYDRPIPRRIAEEAGIPRQLIGQSKKAASRSLKYCDPYSVIDPDLKTVMAPASYRDFDCWTCGIPLFGGELGRLSFRALNRLYHLNLRVLRSRRARLAARRFGLHLPDAPCIPIRFRKRRTLHRLLFHWGMQHVNLQYAGAIVAPSLDWTMRAAAHGSGMRACQHPAGAREIHR
jgi:hypothetical protein